MGQGLQNIGLVMLDGLSAVTSVTGVLGFLVLFAFVMSMAFKLKQANPQTHLGREVFWGYTASLSSFLVLSVGFFLASTPFLPSFGANPYLWGLSFVQFMTLLACCGWVLLMVYLCVPAKAVPQQVSLEKEDDISAMPFVGMLLGFCLSVLLYTQNKWSDQLIGFSTDTEVMGQAAFYGFVFVLPVLVVWTLLVAVFYKLLKRVFESFLPQSITLGLLVLALVYQVVFQYL